MKFEFITNTCGVFHGDKGTKILCDSWVKDDETICFKEFEITLCAPFAKNNFYDAKIGNIIDSAMLIQNNSIVAFNANDNTPISKAWDACALYLKDEIYQGTDIICLREHDIFNLTIGRTNKEYISLNTLHMNKYIKNDLSKIKYPYEYDKSLDTDLLLEEMELALVSMKRSMDNLGIELDTTIYITINDEDICYEPDLHSALQFSPVVCNE